jgi:hypothetical protein
MTCVNTQTEEGVYSLPSYKKKLRESKYKSRGKGRGSRAGRRPNAVGFSVG